jgi:hypothetical protein
MSFTLAVAQDLGIPTWMRPTFLVQRHRVHRNYPPSCLSLRAPSSYPMCSWCRPGPRCKHSTGELRAVPGPGWLIGARARRTSSARQCTASVDEELIPRQRRHGTFGRGSRGCLGRWIAQVRLKTRWEDGGTSRRELELEVVPQMRCLLHCVVPCTTVPVQLWGCFEHNRPHLPLNSVSRAKISCLASVKHLFSKERSLFGEHWAVI